MPLAYLKLTSLNLHLFRNLTKIRKAENVSELQSKTSYCHHLRVEFKHSHAMIFKLMVS